MRTAVALALAFTLAAPTLATAQTFPTDDSVIQRMWEVGIENSQTEALAHHLMDYIGPRLAGSPNLAAAQDWLDHHGNRVHRLFDRDLAIPKRSSNCPKYQAE